MSRDPWKLKVFLLADELVVDAYHFTQEFPASERFGLQAQIRRAAVSTAANLVEGCARPSLGDYRKFVAIALASASEVRYLIGLSARLGLCHDSSTRVLERRYGDLIRGLQVLVDSLERLGLNQPEA